MFVTHKLTTWKLDILFLLAVSSKSEATKQHLIDTLHAADYELTLDHQGTKYIGYEVKRTHNAIELSVPGYVDKVLHRFRHRNIVPCKSPFLYEAPDYKHGAGQVPITDDSESLTPAETTEAQSIIGAILWYSRMLDSPTLTAVNALATELAERKSSINPKLDRLLGNLMMYPNNVLVYHASDMVFHASSDYSHLSVSRARGRAGLHGFFGFHNAPTFYNGPVVAGSQVLDVVVSSAAEGEYGAAYLVARETVYVQAIAKALGYPQLQPTTLLCDNSTAVGLANDSVKIAKTKAIDQRYHWLRDRVRQGQFRVE
jgi:hypothetical protein